ncbi:MAG: hypothetical protein ACOCXT_02275 [Candidatus Dojkabacteria bacterium]
MIVHQRTNWMKRIASLRSPQLLEWGIYVLLLILLFGAISLFGNKIITAVNTGFETQNKIEEIEGDIAELEEENRRLTYLRDLYTSDQEIESHYRSLQQKKMEGEEVYVISIEQDDKEVTSDILEDIPLQEENRKGNSIPVWQQWIQAVF